jgi:hypothetical protein
VLRANYASAEVSCQEVLENFPTGYLADSKNIDLIVENPNSFLPGEFNFQDAITLINDLLKKKSLDEKFRTETLDSVYHRDIRILNVRHPLAKGLVRSKIIWNNEKPETTEALVNRLLEAVTIIYQTKIPRMGPIKILTKSPIGFLRETERQAIEMLRLQNTILEILGHPATYQPKLRLSKVRETMNAPLSLLIDRQRAELRFIRRTPELTQALNNGDLVTIGRMIALHYGSQTYIRWFWQVVSDSLIVTTVATLVSLGPSFVQSINKLLQVTHQVYGTPTAAALERAETATSSSDDSRLRVLSDTLDDISTKNLKPDEKEYVKSLTQMIRNPPSR